MLDQLYLAWEAAQYDILGNKEVKALDASLLNTKISTDLLVQLLIMKSRVLMGVETLVEADKLIDQVILFCSNNEMRKAEAKVVKARINFIQGKQVESQNILLDFSPEILNETLKAEYFYVMGMSTRNQGEIEKALSHFNLGYSLVKGGKHRIVGEFIVSIQSILTIKGLKNNSNEIKLALSIFENLGNHRLKASLLRELGINRIRQRKYFEAIEYLEESQALKKNAPPISQSYTLQYLIIALIESRTEENLKKAVEYTNYLISIEPDKPNRYFSISIELTQGLCLKSSNRLAEKAQAIGIFKTALNMTEYIEARNLTYLIVNLCELLIDEYRLYQDREALEELQLYLSQLDDIVAQQPTSALKVEIMVFQSRIARIPLDTTERKYSNASDILDEAQRIVTENNLEFLQDLINDEKKLLEEEIRSYQQFLHTYGEIIQQMKKDDLTNFIQMAKHLVSSK